MFFDALRKIWNPKLFLILAALYFFLGVYRAGQGEWGAVITNGVLFYAFTFWYQLAKTEKQEAK